MGNVRSLGNKTDKLKALVKTQREYCDCSIFCFSETWLHSHIPDYCLEVPGYSLVWRDRDLSKSRKKKGGGIALYVSERWGNPGHVNVKERLCTPDIELAVSMCPYYLPREFKATILFTFPRQLMQRRPVRSSAQPLLNYRLNTRMYLWSLQVILIMLYWTKLRTIFTSMLTAPPGKSKCWISYTNAIDAYDGGFWTPCNLPTSPI